MDLPQELDDYIKESIESCLGLPVSEKTLELKLQGSEEARKRLQDQYFYLHGQFKEKDEIVELARAEASMNAQALKKFIEENQKLAKECTNLLAECSRLEKECSLYHRDREVLMEFGNEADGRAKEAEIRVLEAEKELGRLTEDLRFYKHESEIHKVSETRAIEELRVLRERLSEDERVRIQGCGDNHISCSHYSSLNTENQKSSAQILASIPRGDDKYLFSDPSSEVTWIDVAPWHENNGSPVNMREGDGFEWGEVSHKAEEI
ncbi:hypothetical protein HHK36_014671 [Tetracentron sinense]|uniref:Uncharacterized protein n=1 Tax=Tetracentron sinense TaxID=13715 RepID=A0A834Z7T0_TETSI|nr:hypothetical protein HHK36_014671 [Tetracentron sinense]